MAGQTGIAANPFLALLPPDQQQTYAQLSQRQAIGQALLQQGLQPMDAGQNAVGGVAYHVSPLNGVSKLLNEYVGNKISMDAAGKQAQLSAQALGNAFGGAPQQAAPADPSQAPDAGGIAGGGSGPGVQSYPVQPPGAALGAQMVGAPAAARNGPMALPGYSPQQSLQLYGMLGPEAYGKLLESRTAPTDATRMAWAAGTSPVQANAGALFKANYLPPNQGSPGTIARDPRTNQPIYYSPDVPKGGEPVFTADGRVVGVKQLDGSLKLIGDAAAAQAGGEGSQLPYAGVDAQGNPLPVTNRTAAATGGGNASQPPPIPTLPGLAGQGGAGGSNVPLPVGPLPGGGPIYAAPPMGAATNAEAAAHNQQDELSKKWTDLSAQNTQAQSTTSYLQNIKALAPQAALGQQSDRLNYINGLLSLAGSKPATDMVTANNLLDKYSNQITARLSAGGMGTDSARAILQSAYPNAHMDKDAINEAADNLIGANQMLQAKTRVLAPLANSRNPTAYNNAEVQFDQAADPRIWQLQNMATQDQAKYVSGLAPSVAKTLLQHRQVLRGLGAIQ